MSVIRARLGARLRRLRRERNLTQEGLAERAGVSYKFLGEIERGTGNPSLDTLERVSRALNVEVTDLFGPPQQASQYPDAPRELTLVREALMSLESWLTQGAPPPSARGRARRKKR